MPLFQADPCPKHLRQRRDEIRNTPITKPPLPWVELSMPLIGGLVEIGFSETSDYLLAITWNGRGVFNCSTGEKVARDAENFGGDEPWYNGMHMKAQGIGPVAEQWIPLCGIWGGGLRRQTDDGWQIEEETLDWPIRTYLLKCKNQIGVLDIRKSFVATVIERDSDIIAFGFSWSGKHLVLVQSHTLRLWKRD